MPERSMLGGVPAPTAHTCSRVSVARQRVRAGRGVVGCGAPAASIQRRGLAIVPKMSASPLRGRGASMSSHHIQRPHLQCLVGGDALEGRDGAWRRSKRRFSAAAAFGVVVEVVLHLLLPPLLLEALLRHLEQLEPPVGGVIAADGVATPSAEAAGPRLRRAAHPQRARRSNGGTI